MTALLVDPNVTRRKFRREVDFWTAHSAHRERGWLLLDRNDDVPSVEVGFLAKLPTSTGSGPVSVLVCAIRLTYENFDLWPPSLTFIDVFTREPAMPAVRAFLPTPEGFRDVLINGHPETGLPFLCLPGIREYHRHPQHSGDDWLLHRQSRSGSLTTVCERVWRLMARNILGVNVAVQTLPVWPLQAQLVVKLSQGDIDSFLGTPDSGADKA